MIRKIKQYADDFRNAIECAAETGEKDELLFFNRFPKGCCGDACNLLAQYLLEKEIKVKYVCGTYYYDDSSYDSQSHAWLLIDDCIIVDITGDQFKDNAEFFFFDQSVFVGEKNKFYNLFDVNPMRDIYKYENTSLSTIRLRKLYGIIQQYIRKPSLNELIVNAEKRKNISGNTNRKNDSETIREIGTPKYRNKNTYELDK